MNKIKVDYLSRAAYVYVRQSSKEQVAQNIESRRLQYSLRDRALGLGWREIEVIDEDLGKSGSGATERAGFERLLSDVCGGKVGAVFAVDASRFARNGREWHTLLELCALVDVLIIDQDSIYDPRQPDDRLILGMKGTLSEMELGMLRQRMQKAKRGELYSRIAVGYVREGESDRLVKDPNRRVQSALDSVFNKFRELGSARQVCQWYRQEGIELPVVPVHSRGYVIVWKTPNYGAIAGLLTNPVYAGAYVYGRTKSRTVIENGHKRVKAPKNNNPEQWDILLPDHYEGYISWEEYLANRRKLIQNCGGKSRMTGGAARKGAALLTGLLRCGQCGQKMSIHYQGKDNSSVRYYCMRDAKQGAPVCFSVSATLLDPAVENIVLETLSSVALQAALQAYESLRLQDADLIRQHELKLEQGRYEAERMQRQYNAIEPENRLVAAELESRWNRALEQVEVVKKELCEASTRYAPLTENDQAKILALADDLPAVWQHPCSDAALKKRIARTVLKEIVVFCRSDDNPYQERIECMLHWQGGDHTKITVRRKKRAKNGNVTNAEEIELIAQLARIMNDRDIAALLNRAGKRTARGLSWSLSRVMILRQKNQISPYRPGERDERGELTLDEAAAKFGTYRIKIMRLIARKTLPAKQVCFRAP
jgi:DNA invertase Pin-like site-specific DNA recombinase